METWAWLGAYLIGFALLQVYLYLYFMKGRSQTADSSAEHATSIPEGASTAVEPPSDVDSRDLLCCEECGTYNKSDPMFVYCKHCGTRLE